MKQYLFILITTFLLTLFTFSVHAEEESSEDKSLLLKLEESNCGETFDVIPKKIEIRLNALTSAGYDWFLEEGYPPARVSRTAARESGLLGGEVVNTFTIEPTLEEGSTSWDKTFNLTFIYKRPWEKEIIKKCSYYIREHNNY